MSASIKNLDNRTTGKDLLAVPQDPAKPEAQRLRAVVTGTGANGYSVQCYNQAGNSMGATFAFDRVQPMAGTVSLEIGAEVVVEFPPNSTRPVIVVGTGSGGSGTTYLVTDYIPVFSE